MAIPATAVWEVRTTGSDVNGGAWNTVGSGTDYSQQNASQYSGTDGSSAGSTAFTSLGSSFGVDVVGNAICISGGSISLVPTRRIITARVSATQLTLDTTVSSGTGFTFNIGGAVQSPAIPCGLAVLGNKTWVKSGTYLISNTVSNSAGGIMAMGREMEGYNATRGDLGTPPIFKASGIASVAIITLNVAGAILINITVDGDNLTGIRGISSTLTGMNYIKCGAINCKDRGIIVTGDNCLLSYCFASGCSTAGQAFEFGSSVYCFGCVSFNNTVTGFSGTGHTSYNRCISYNNTGATTDGFTGGAQSGPFMNCVAYGNGRDGFRITGASVVLSSCIAESNVGVGFNNSSVSSFIQLINCAHYGNGSATNGTFNRNINPVTGSSSFFTNAAGGDFTLNNTVGGGQGLRAVGSFGFSYIGYTDTGALQHQDSGGGGGTTEHSHVF